MKKPKELSERTKLEMEVGRRKQELYAFVEALNGNCDLIEKRYPHLKIYAMFLAPEYERVFIRVYLNEEWKERYHNAALIFDHTEDRTAFPSDFFLTKLALVV